MKLSIKSFGYKPTYWTLRVEDESTKIENDDVKWEDLVDIAIQIARMDGYEKEILHKFSEEITNHLQ